MLCWVSCRVLEVRWVIWCVCRSVVLCVFFVGSRLDRLMCRCFVLVRCVCVFVLI